MNNVIGGTSKTSAELADGALGVNEFDLSSHMIASHREKRRPVSKVDCVCQ